MPIIDSPYEPKVSKQIVDGKLVVTLSDGKTLEYSKDDILAIKKIMQQKEERLRLRSVEIEQSIAEADADLAKL